MKSFFKVTEKLNHTIKDRIKNKPTGSYTVDLVKSGSSRMAQKVGEEALEVALAAQKKKNDELIYETADLWYHLLVLLEAKGVSLDDVAKELESRYNK